jgi:hypothetical protein
MASTKLITDMQTCTTTALSATATAAQIAAAGPIMDVTANFKLCVVKLQEVQSILNYILGGSAVAPSSLTAPTGGLVTNAADSTIYSAAVGVFQLLK